MTPHIEAKENEIAKIVIMPGDPVRAKLIADKFLEDAKLVSNVRGMNTFTGTYKGTKVTILQKKVAYKNGYYWDKVKLSNGTVGYIATKYLS